MNNFHSYLLSTSFYIYPLYWSMIIIMLYQHYHLEKQQGRSNLLNISRTMGIMLENSLILYLESLNQLQLMYEAIQLQRNSCLFYFDS